jgi:hypothetical protein
MTQLFTFKTSARTTTRSSMRRTTKFTAALVALSLGVSSLAAVPARAAEEDVALAVGGLLSLFILSKAIENAGDNKPSAKIAYKQPSKPTPQKRKRADAFKIPNKCVASARGRNNRVRTVAFESCVKRAHRTSVKLPSACETRVRTSKGRAQAYELGCLNNFGYRVTRG